MHRNDVTPPAGTGSACIVADSVAGFTNALRDYIPRLSPADVRYLATILIAEGESLMQSERIASMATEIATANEPGLGIFSHAHIATPETLEKFRDRISLLDKSSTTIMAELVAVLQRWVVTAIGTLQGPENAHVLRQYDSVVDHALHHPAAKGPVAEQLRSMRVALAAAGSALSGGSGPAIEMLLDTLPGLPSGHSLKATAKTFTSQTAPLLPRRQAPQRPPTGPIGIAGTANNSIGGQAGVNITGNGTDSERALEESLQKLPPQQHSQKVRSWLKALRLHKYCEILERLNYQEMISLQESDLERLGISAKGARTKMLKSIQGLKQRNLDAAKAMTSLNQNVAAGAFTDTIKGLSEMLDQDQTMDAPQPDHFNMISEFMKVVGRAYTGLVLTHSHSNEHPAPNDVRNFFSLLDKALRHPTFSVEHKKVLFSWKNDCQHVIGKWNPQLYRPDGNGNRLPQSSPWGKSQGTPLYSSAARIAQPATSDGSGSKQKKRQAFDTRTRSARSQSLRGQSSGGVQENAQLKQRADFGSTASLNTNTNFGSNPFLSNDDPQVSFRPRSIDGAQFDTFGFGPVTSPWSGTQRNDEQQSTYMPIATSSKVESLWNQSVEDLATAELSGSGHQLSGDAGIRSQSLSKQGADQMASIWSDPQADSLMQSLHSSLSDLALQEKRSTAHF